MEGILTLMILILGMSAKGVLHSRVRRALLIALCVVFPFFASTMALADSPLIAPGGHVQLKVGTIDCTEWRGKPLWKATSINVKPEPLKLPDGQRLEWTMDHVHVYNPEVISVEENLREWSRYPDHKLPDDRTYDILIDFTLQNDNRLLGQTISFDVNMLVVYQRCEGKAIDLRGYEICVAQKHEMRITTPVTFTVSTADEVNAYRVAQFKLFSYITSGIVILLIALALACKLLLTREKWDLLLNRFWDWLNETPKEGRMISPLDEMGRGIFGLGILLIPFLLVGLYYHFAANTFGFSRGLDDDVMIFFIPYIIVVCWVVQRMVKKRGH